MLKIKIKIEKDVLIDDKDKDLVSNYEWFIGGSRKAYAIAHTSKGLTYMHRLIMGNPNSWVDHINGNTFDNRKENLRVCNPSQSRANSRKVSTPTSSKYIGVHQKAPKRGWSAEVCFKGKRIYLGEFETPELAAEARDKKAKELHGEFVHLNFK